MATTYSESLRSFHTSEANMNMSFRGLELDGKQRAAVLVDEEGGRAGFSTNMDLRIVEVRGEDNPTVTISTQPKRTLRLADPREVAHRTEEGALVEVPRLQTMNNPVVEKDLT